MARPDINTNASRRLSPEEIQAQFRERRSEHDRKVSEVERAKETRRFLKKSRETKIVSSLADKIRASRDSLPRVVRGEKGRFVSTSKLV